VLRSNEFNVLLISRELISDAYSVTRPGPIAFHSHYQVYDLGGRMNNLAICRSKELGAKGENFYRIFVLAISS